MSKKALILSMIGLILIGGSVYYSLNTTATMNKKTFSTITTQEKDAAAIAPPIVTKNQEQLSSEPKENSSNEDIIDYLVDGLTQNESNILDAVLSATGTVTNEDPTIGINF